MNQAKTTDFFPNIDEHHSSLVAPNIFRVYRETEDDLRHEKLLTEIENQLNKEAAANSQGEWGELPYDEEADRQRWENLEKDFDRVFEAYCTD